MFDFIWFILLGLFLLAIIVVGLFSLAVFIEAVFNPNDEDPDFWKE